MCMRLGTPTPTASTISAATAARSRTFPRRIIRPFVRSVATVNSSVGRTTRGAGPALRTLAVTRCNSVAGTGSSCTARSAANTVANASFCAPRPGSSAIRRRSSACSLVDRWPRCRSSSRASKPCSYVDDIPRYSTVATRALRSLSAPATSVRIGSRRCAAATSPSPPGYRVSRRSRRTAAAGNSPEPG